VRHQLPVFSPVPLSAVGVALAGSVGLRREARRELTSLLAREYSADRVVLCGSGTEALCLAIQSAQRLLSLDAIVALPAFTCFDVGTAAIGAKARVTFYDVDASSLSPDFTSLDRAIDDGARIVVVSPLYGIPVDWLRLEQLASTRGVVLIEDAAQGHGASYRGVRLGGLGKISTLSFGRGKGWTGGSGGALLLRGHVAEGVGEFDLPAGDPIVSAVLLAAQWALGRPSLYGLPQSVPGLALGETVFHVPRRVVEISDSAAAAILASKSAAVGESEIRRENGAWFEQQLATHSTLHRVRSGSVDAIPGYLRFPLLAPRGITGFGDDARLLGIAPSYPHPLWQLAPLAGSVGIVRDYPGAERLSSQLLTLPVHSRLSAADRTAIAERLRAHR
jgi:dTDP-4-amino-4,6-dideoxygalactose transaminase